MASRPQPVRRTLRLLEPTEKLGWAIFLGAIVGAPFFQWFAPNSIPWMILRLAAYFLVLATGAILIGCGVRARRRRLEASRYLVCPGCGYSLVGLDEVGLCPECARPFIREALVEDWKMLIHRYRPATTATRAPKHDP